MFSFFLSLLSMASRNNPLLQPSAADSAASTASSGASETGKLISHFRVGMEIGRGSFANVYKGIDITASATENNNKNRTVAIKSVFRNRLKNDKLISNLEIEIKILRNLKNPHIVSLLDCVKTDTYFHLIMDYCSLGDLSYFIRKKNQLADCHPVIKTLLDKYPSPEGSNGLNQILVINFVKQLATALEFLRSQNLIHRDIKPQNFLLCIPCHTKREFIENNYSGFWELPILKVADFGFARYLPSSSMAETLCGSPLYMAPEILRYEKYNAKADLWSVGTVIYEMVVGKPPFRASNHIELLKKIEKSNDEIVFPNNYEIDQNLVNLICNLMKANPIDRMGFNEFFNDPIIIENNHLIESDSESISYSVENEEMYISEYLDHNRKLENQKTNISKKNTEKNASQVANTQYLETENANIGIDDHDHDQLSKPLNKLVIEEEDENEDNVINNETNHIGEEYTQKQEQVSNFNTFKSQVSKGTITKPHVYNKLVQPTNQHAEDSLKNQQQNLLNKVDYKNNNLIVEKDYVVVEKRNVEVNSFADEVTRATSIGSNRKQSFSLQRQPSRGSRRYSLSVSPSNALKDVLDYTSEKLFGVINNSTKSNNDVKPEELVKKLDHETTQITPLSTPLREEMKMNINNIITKRDVVDQHQSSETVLINNIERLSMMAHSISLYGLVKFSQVIPLPPSSMDINKRNLLDPYNVTQDVDPLLKVVPTDVDPNSEAYSAVYKQLCQEGLVLYLKVLTLLSEAIEISNKWWNENKFMSDISPKVGELIQWIRNRFNESLEKAEYLKLRINRFDEGKHDHVSVDIQNEHFICEKMIFDRAIEISKESANKELELTRNASLKDVNELKKLETAYSVAVWMLESLIHKSSSSSSSSTTEALENSDRQIVESFINSIGTRLIVLRNRIDKLV